MYQILMRVNRYFTVAAAAILLVSFAFPSIQSFLGLDTMAGLIVYSTILAGTALMDKHLARLSFKEVMAKINATEPSLEEMQADFWKKEKARKAEKPN